MLALEMKHINRETHIIKECVSRCTDMFQKAAVVVIENVRGQSSRVFMKLEILFEGVMS
jgi:hypothetical protein